MTGTGTLLARFLAGRAAQLVTVSVGLVLVPVLADCGPTHATSVVTHARTISTSSATTSAAAAGDAQAQLHGVCAFLAGVNQAAAAATSPTQGMAALKRLQPQVHAVAASAPPAAAADLRVLSAAVDRSVQSSKLDPMATDPVAAAGTHLAKLCAS